MFVKYELINYAYIVGAVCVGIAVFVYAIRSNTKFSSIFLIALLFRLSTLFQTILFSGSILDWGYYTITLLSLICLAENTHSNLDRVRFFKAAAVLLAAYLSINACTIMLWPDGVTEGLYFLGYRTRIVEVFLVAIVASVYVDAYDQKRVSFRTILILILGIAQILALSVVTALVGVGFAIGAFILFKYTGIGREPRLFNFITCFGLLLTIAFCFFHIQNYFADFIQQVLHKSATLSSRATIWELGIDMFFKNPLFGYGIVDNSNHIEWITSWNTANWQAHNNTLQILLDGGLLALITFYALLLSIGKKLKNGFRQHPRSAIAMALWLSFNFMSISEIFVLQNYYFLFLLLLVVASRMDGDALTQLGKDEIKQHAV